MSTIATAVVAGAVVALAAVIAGLTVALHGTRKGYKFSAALSWSPPAKPKAAAKAEVRPLREGRAS